MLSLVKRRCVPLRALARATASNDSGRNSVGGGPKRPTCAESPPTRITGTNDEDCWHSYFWRRLRIKCDLRSRCRELATRDRIEPGRVGKIVGARKRPDAIGLTVAGWAGRVTGGRKLSWN